MIRNKFYLNVSLESRCFLINREILLCINLMFPVQFKFFLLLYFEVAFIISENSIWLRTG